MRRTITDNTTVKEVMEEIVRLEQKAGTYYLNNAKIYIKLNPKKQL